MTTQNFTQFSTTTLTTGDYVVGYKEDGSAEFKSPVQSIIDLVQSPGVQDPNNSGINWSLTPPLTTTSPGASGEIAFSENYLYVCVAPDTWKRVILASW